MGGLGLIVGCGNLRLLGLWEGLGLRGAGVCGGLGSGGSGGCRLGGEGARGDRLEAGRWLSL